MNQMPKLLSSSGRKGKSDPNELVANTRDYLLLMSDPSTQTHYRQVRSAWQMQDRYLRRTVDKDTAKMLKTSFREPTKWTLKKYV